MARSAKYVIAAFGQGLRDNIVNLLCKPYSRMKGLSADHTLAFLDRQDLVRFDLLDDVGKAARPQDLQTFRGGCSRQSKMHSQIILPEVT